MAYLLEVVAYDIDSCRVIEQSGAGRIELCANPLEGGTTPSYGMIKVARKHASIPVYCMIRPRGGHFLYSEAELTVMRNDIRFCKENGMDGVVLGLLTKERDIAIPALSELVELAYPMEVTFHRAFDRTRYPLDALEAIIQSGCTRILSSGAAATALEGMAMINRYIAAARNRIGILPGGGIRSENIAEIAGSTGVTEFHSSAIKRCLSTLDQQDSEPGVTTSSNCVDPEELNNCLEVLHRLENKSSE